MQVVLLPLYIVPINNGSIITKFKKKLLCNKKFKSIKRKMAPKKLEFFIKLYLIFSHGKT